MFQLRPVPRAGIRETIGRVAGILACLVGVHPFTATCPPTAAQAGGPGPDGGQPPEAWVHESWTVEEGLPVNSVNSLLQSRDGYLWIATFDGLVRFDGVRFTVFNSTNSAGLPSSRLVLVREARDGSLWLATEQRQLIRFRDGVFTLIGPERGLAHRLVALHEDENGWLWVATEEGLGVVRGERFEPVAPETIRGVVNVILRRSDGALWVGGAGGVFRVAGGAATRVLPLVALADEPVTALAESPAGTLWIGTGGGVWRYRDAAGQAPRATAGTQARPDRGELGRLHVSGPPIGAVYRFLRSPSTGRMYLYTETGVYWTEGGAVAPVHPPRPVGLVTTPIWTDGAEVWYALGTEVFRGERRVYSLGGEATGPLPPATVTTATLDREGSLWLGTHGGGLHRLKPASFTVYGQPEGLVSRNAYTVYEDPAGTVWVGTWGTHELGRIDPRTGRVESFGHARGVPPDVRSLLRDPGGRLWVGGGSGLFSCSVPEVACRPEGPPQLRGAAVLALHRDGVGRLWVGSSAGLFRLEDGGWARVPGAPEHPVRAFAPTPGGALWMATDGGGLARHEAGRFTSVTTADGLPFDRIRSLYPDAEGGLWVGTEGRGLARLDPREWADGRRGGRIAGYRMQDGLFDEVIHQILEDDFGRLWMSSNRGIFWVTRAELLAFAAGRTSRIHSTGYTERDGLRNREANGGSQPAGVRTRDGRLWFPTQDGLAVVDPARIQRNTVPPGVVIEEVRAGGVELRPGGGALELGVEQRDLEFDYTALSFLAPANVRFRYRLEGYDGDWVEAGNRRTAYYTRVPPGRYTFRVIASNNDGVWNEEGAALQLRLAPRFHETGAFRLLALLLAGLVVAGGVGWRVRSLRARTRELARLVEERTAELREHEVHLEAQNAQLERQAGQLQELDRAKSHFFANLSHEFRTPLTLIVGPLRDLSEELAGTLPEWLRRRHEMMLRNAQRLQRLVNQVLDLARLESGALTLQTEPHDLVELARTNTHSFTPLAERRSIALHFHADAEPLPVEVDTEQIEKVLLNLLSNAFKFTEPGGRVEVRVGQEEGSAMLEVRDSGIGIAPEQLPHVFERFYQADSSATRRHEGTGIGLSLVRELVELHGGSVGARSRPGEGSTFTVRLPLGGRRPVGPPHPPTPSPTRGEGEQIERVSVPFPLALHRRGGAERGTSEAGVRAAGPGEGSGEGGLEPVAEAEDRTTVLVVDDNADVRAYVRSLLEPGLRVIEAADGEEGLARACDALPDLVVADVMMPRLDGFGLVRALREQPLTDCIPVILLTARAAPGHEVEGLGAGADDYVAKPFHAAVLQARVAGLIGSRRRLRERFRAEGLPAPSHAVEPEPVRSALEARLRAIVEANLTDPDFDPEALAAAAGLSYKQLHRRISRELGSTPTRFIRSVRAERAADLLREGAGSITEVAYSVGFNSLSYFHRCFHERFGIAPSELPKLAG